jgi:polyribonucleotide nucleotidyltransferase
MVMHEETIWIDKAIEIIEAIVREAKVGEIYTAAVVRIEKYGVFCKLWEGCEGLCHISRLAKERVEKCENVVSLGDQIIVKCISIDEKGRVDLSRKDALTPVAKPEVTE